MSRYQADNGYISPNEKPSSPVEWTTFNGAGTYTFGGGTSGDTVTLFEADVSGFDSYGYAVLASGYGTSDNITIYFRHPNGANFNSAYLSFYSSSSAASASQDAEPVISSRVVVVAEITNYSGTPGTGTINVELFARRTSRND